MRLARLTHQRRSPALSSQASPTNPTNPISLASRITTASTTVRTIITTTKTTIGTARIDTGGAIIVGMVSAMAEAGTITKRGAAMLGI